MGRVNVLSIDWDYFIGCDCLTRLMKFPDGGNENLSPWLQTLVWNTRYNDLYLHTKGAESLSSIPVFDPAYKDMCKFLRSSRRIRTYAAESHSMIYPLVEDLFNKYDEVEVWNLDFHHDMFVTGGNSLDCGNWLRFFADLKPDANITWVRREDSDTDSLFGEFPYHHTTHISEIQGEFDLVFLCFSSPWTPPHLYDKFVEMVNCVNL